MSRRVLVCEIRGQKLFPALPVFRGVRGHTMFHVDSKGAISYAEFRHLGKPGVLGRYSLHFHLAGDSMRGASVIGASTRDSGNRWITVHGTNYLPSCGVSHRSDLPHR